MHVSIYYCVIEEFRSELDGLLSLLRPEEHERALRFLRDEDRLRYSVGRLLLRDVTSSLTGDSREGLNIRLDKHGKPFIPDGPAFNLSHSGSIVLIGVCEQPFVGVDIEAVRCIDDMESLASMCFSADELNRFYSLPREDRTGAFFRIWTRKEALVKAIGKGLKIDLKTFSVSPERSDRNQLLSLPGEASSTGAWSIFDVPVSPGYEAAVAVSSMICTFDVVRRDEASFRIHGRSGQLQP